MYIIPPKSSFQSPFETNLLTLSNFHDRDVSKRSNRACEKAHIHAARRMKWKKHRKYIKILVTSISSPLLIRDSDTQMMFKASRRLIKRNVYRQRNVPLLRAAMNTKRINRRRKTFSQEHQECTRVYARALDRTRSVKIQRRKGEQKKRRTIEHDLV